MSSSIYVLFGSNVSAVVTALDKASLLGEQYASVFVRGSHMQHISLKVKVPVAVYLEKVSISEAMVLKRQR